jgi:hypothetical protein
MKRSRLSTLKIRIQSFNFSILRLFISIVMKRFRLNTLNIRIQSFRKFFNKSFISQWERSQWRRLQFVLNLWDLTILVKILSDSRNILNFWNWIYLISSSFLLLKSWIFSTRRAVVRSILFRKDQNRSESITSTYFLVDRSRSSLIHLHIHRRTDQFTTRRHCPLHLSWKEKLAIVNMIHKFRECYNLSTSQMHRD